MSIGVIGLYVAFAIPIYYRWRLGDTFKPGLVDARAAVQVDGPAGGRRDRHHVASTSCSRPRPPALPGNEDFTWVAVNYTPIVVFGVLIAITIWWQVSAKNWFTGPKHTIDLPAGVSSADEIALEHHDQDLHRHLEGGAPPA